jgi:hypothetical protein
MKSDLFVFVMLSLETMAGITHDSALADCDINEFDFLASLTHSSASSPIETIFNV